MNLTSLPTDIRIKIMEYMVPHICPTKRDKERLQKHAIQRQIYNITKNNTYSSYGSLYKYINHDKEHIFKVLKMCKCCLRHQQNRPSSLTENIIYPQNNDYTAEEIVCKLNICACPCRHISRYITNYLYH